MKVSVFLLMLCSAACAAAQKTPVAAATKFFNMLSGDLRAIVLYPADDPERLNWSFLPGPRKGASFHDMNNPQAQAAMDLLRACLSREGYRKATSILALENILRELENRDEGDDYRDPLKYYFTFFGTPDARGHWGWRIEGHHLSLNYSVNDGKVVSATPTFIGANPATIITGLDRGKRILKRESDLGFFLVNSLSPEQLDKALIARDAPRDIITGTDRDAGTLYPRGVYLQELDDTQKENFLNLLEVYIGNYETETSNQLMARIKAAGIDNLSFAWAGSLQPGQGHYYRIQGPTLLIEYANTQHNANHIHTVVRDLRNDFGGVDYAE